MKIFVGFAASVVLLGSIGTASAITINATITADNHYALYFGNEAGTVLNHVGRNEIGSGGSPGTYNWSQAETYNFDIGVNDYIYVAAWSDDRVAQGWIGQFETGTNTIYTNTSDWEVYLTSSNLGDGSAAPSLTELATTINAANIYPWTSVSDYIDHGAGPWGSIDGISQDADWIWGSALTPGSGKGEYQLFRTKAVAPVPEPATMILFGTGLIGLASARVRKKRK